MWNHAVPPRLMYCEIPSPAGGGISLEEQMGTNSLISEVRWERYPLVAENFHSRDWLTWQCNRGLAANTVEAYGRGLERHLLSLRAKA
jgi:hypothetical protein